MWTTYLDQETHMYMMPAMPRIKITQAMMISAYGNTSPLNATAVCVRTDSGGITGACMSMAFARTNVDTSKVIFDMADLSMMYLSNIRRF